MLRDHALKNRYFGPRFLVRIAASRCTRSTRRPAPSCSKDAAGIGYCNITKCCTEVCPEDIHITDNAIIPLKERVADRYYDPLFALGRLLRRGLRRDATGSPG